MSHDPVEMILQAFKNAHRLQIIRHLVENRQKRVYVSEVARKLKISKGSAFVHLSELDEAGVLDHRWESTRTKMGAQKAVKSYSLNPIFPGIVRKMVVDLFKEPRQESLAAVAEAGTGEAPRKEHRSTTRTKPDGRQARRRKRTL